MIKKALDLEVTKIQHILWSGLIFWLIIFTVLEVPLNLTYKLPLKSWELFLDGAISLAFIFDFFFRNEINPKKSSKKNFYKWPSLLYCLPYDIIIYSFDLHPAIALISMLRVFKLMQIFQMFSILREMTIIPKWIQIQILIIFSSVAIHWIACIWTIIHQTEPIEDILTTHVTSFYWAVTTLTTIGYGDITPHTNLGRIFTMMVMILGVGVYGIIIANVSNMISNANHYKEKSKQKINDLSYFMKHYDIPHRLQKTVFAYYEHLLKERLSDNDAQIIADLPPALQNDIRTYMNIKMIKPIDLFRKSTLFCLRDVATRLEQRFYPPGHDIIKIGEIGQEMYIIFHGTVEIFHKDGSLIATLHDGQIFGEASLLKETTRNANVRSKGYCDVYKLSKESFLEIIGKHPDLLARLEDITKSRAA